MSFAIRWKEILARWFSVVNIYPAVLTNADDLKQLIDRLKPKETNQGLIRLGKEGDGGYLVPDDLEDISSCFSPGVNTISDFEKDCAARGMEVFLADESVDAPALQDDRFHFIKKYIGGFEREGVVQIDDWVRSCLVNNQDSDLLLQMDIEGCEYEVLMGMSQQTQNRLRIMVIEFHNLHLLWNAPVFEHMQAVFSKIMNTHTCVHIHPNNVGEHGAFQKNGIQIPRLMEFTFFRNDRMKTSSFQTQFPHPLDSDNTDAPAMVLPPCWHG